MRFDLFHHHARDHEVPPWVADLHDKLDLILERQDQIMATFDDLKAAVARNSAVDSSVVTLLQGISQQLKDAQAANDPAAIQSVIDQLDANTKTLSDAVTANTPAPPQAAPAS